MAPADAGEGPQEPSGRSSLSAAHEALLSPGDLVGGRYRILGELGSGAMGVVFRALEEQLERPVALKLIHPKLAASPRQRDQFLREARAMARVRHPNVITIHAFGQHEDKPYLAMELVDGLELDKYLARRAQAGGLSDAEAVSLLLGVCDGVSAIHAAGVTHGDVKPSNVLVCDEGRPHVVDFGLARLLEGGAVERVSLGGTPTYLAPELASGRALTPELTPRIDVYSLGVMAYELLVGRPPFIADSLDELLRMHAYEPAPSPLTRRPELGKLGERALLGALHKDPRRRTESAETLRRDLLATGELLARRGRALGVAVVDDDPDFRRYVREILDAGLPGLEVDVYPDGAALLVALTDRTAPSLVLLDLDLPVQNGLELLAILREQLEPTPKICVVTAVGGARDWSVLRELGATAFLPKPLDPEVLVHTVGRLLEAD